MTASSARDARALTRIEKLLDEGVILQAWTDSESSAFVVVLTETTTNEREQYRGEGADFASALGLADSIHRNVNARQLAA